MNFAPSFNYIFNKTAYGNIRQNIVLGNNSQIPDLGYLILDYVKDSPKYT